MRRDYCICHQTEYFPSRCEMWGYLRNIHTGIPLDNLQIVLLDAAAAYTTTSPINMHPTSATHVFIRDKKGGNKNAREFQSQMSIIFVVKGRGLKVHNEDNEVECES